MKKPGRRSSRFLASILAVAGGIATGGPGVVAQTPAAPPAGGGSHGVELTSLLGPGTEGEADLKKADSLGIQVLEVAPQLQAAKAGLRVGDVILGVNGRRVFSTPELRYVVGDRTSSGSVPSADCAMVHPGTLTVLRAGELLTLSVDKWLDVPFGYNAVTVETILAAVLADAGATPVPRDRLILAGLPARAWLMIAEWSRRHPGELKGAAWFSDFCRRYVAVTLGDYAAALRPAAEAPIPFVQMLSGLYARIAEVRRAGGLAASAATLQTPRHVLALFYPLPLPPAPSAEWELGAFQSGDAGFAKALRARIAGETEIGPADPLAARLAAEKRTDPREQALCEMKAAALDPEHLLRLPQLRETLCLEHHPESNARFREWQAGAAGETEPSLMLMGRTIATIRAGSADYRDRWPDRLRELSDHCPWLFRVAAGGTTYIANYRRQHLLPVLPVDWASDLSRRDAFWHLLLYRARGRIDGVEFCLDQPPAGLHRDAWGLRRYLSQFPLALQDLLAEPAEDQPVARFSSATPPTARLLDDLFSSVPWSCERTRQTAAAGLPVVSVAAGSPAARAGLRPGDLLLGVAGTRIMSQEEANLARAEHPERPPDLLVARGGTLVALPLLADDGVDLGFRGPDPAEALDALVATAGLRPSDYERALLRRLPARALHLIRAWEAVHPGELKGAGWLADFLRAAAAARSDDPAAALRPIAPAPVPFVNLLNGLHQKAAASRAQGVAVFDAKNYDEPGRVLALCFPYPIPQATNADLLVGPFRTEDREFVRLFRARATDPRARAECVRAAQRYAEAKGGDADARLMNALKAAALAPDLFAAAAYARCHEDRAVEGRYGRRDQYPRENTTDPESTLRLALAVNSWTWMYGLFPNYGGQVATLLEQSPLLGRVVLAYHPNLHSRIPLQPIAELGRRAPEWKPLIDRIAGDSRPNFWRTKRNGVEVKESVLDVREPFCDYVAGYRGEPVPGLDVDALALERFFRGHPALVELLFSNWNKRPDRTDRETPL